MSSFGASTAAGTNIFGSSTTTPATNTGGIFGNTNTNTTQQPGQTTSIFGNTQPQQQQQPTSSIFGSNTSGNAGGGSLFGNTQNQGNTGTGGTSLFGNTQNTGGGSMFGKPATPTIATGAGTGLFGSTTGTNTNTTGSLFGNTQQQQPAANTAAGTGTSSFFATPPAGQQQNANQNQAKPSIFGNASTSTNPLFGGANTNTNTNTTGGGTLFGASNTTTTAPVSGNPLFGNSTTGGSLFGTANTSNTGGNAFGTSTLGSSTLGASALGPKPTTSTLGVSTLGASALGTQTQGQDAQIQFARLQEKIEAIVGAWNPQNPQSCRFQHYFYNLVDPAQVNLYTRPPNAVREDLWQKAVRENPDPSCLVPVLALGFDDLRDRVDAQTQQSTAHREKLTELQARLRTLTTHHTTVTIPRLQRYSALQTQLLHRLLKLVQHLHLLIPSVRSSAIGEGEEELKAQLEDIATEVGIARSSSSGDGSARKGGRLKSKLGELWAVIGALKAREEGLNAMTGGGEWKVVDEEGLARITQVGGGIVISAFEIDHDTSVQVLAEQQAGLAHLTKILQKDLRDLAIIMGTETIPT
ncbi:Nucleoporin nup57 [Paramarasmius palmivorus]|uniref:Nucleoporin nup57 n=1 Tax=Paramarasmius palmivorus TaxID=297713 RepID=A0AAW0EF02_9AGAR